MLNCADVVEIVYLLIGSLSSPGDLRFQDSQVMRQLWDSCRSTIRALGVVQVYLGRVSPLVEGSWGSADVSGLRVGDLIRKKRRI